MISEDHLADLRSLSAGVLEMEEGGVVYVYLPGLRMPKGCEPRTVDALLRVGPGPDGYTTRLFLSVAFQGKGQNWTVHRILDRTWHAFSFNEVPADLRPIEILANHLRVLQ